MDERRVITMVGGHGAGAHQGEKSLVVSARMSIVGGNGHQLKQVIADSRPSQTRLRSCAARVAVEDTRGGQTKESCRIG